MVEEIVRLEVQCIYCGKSFYYLHRVGIAKEHKVTEENEVLPNDREDQDNGEN